MKISYVAIWILISSLSFPQLDPYDRAIQQGKSSLATGNPDQALTEAREAIKQNQNRWEAYALAGGALVAEHKCDEAFDYITDAAARSPEDKKAGLKNLLKSCTAQASTQINAPPTSLSSTATPTQAEIILWKSIENSSRPEDYQAYLDQYPNGTFAVIAKNRLDELEKQRAATAIASTEAEQQGKTFKVRDKFEGEGFLRISKEGIQWRPIGRSDKNLDFGCEGFKYQLLHGDSVRLQGKTSDNRRHTVWALFPTDQPKGKSSKEAEEAVSLLDRYCTPKF